MHDQTESWVSSGQFQGRSRGGHTGGAPHLRRQQAAGIHAAQPRRRGWSRGAWASVLSATLALAGLSVGGSAVADVGTIAHTSLRSGWDNNEPALSPSSVASSNFGKLFS